MVKLASISFASLVPVTLLAAGCGGVESMDDMTDPTGDVEAPTVVSTTPTAAQSSLGADTKIQITFSEPMDPGTVVNAYHSVELPLDKVSTQWNADQTVLTISPDQPLEYGYGTGDDPTTADRKTYSISIGATATDLAGNPLVPLDLSFSTKVRMHSMAFLEAPLSRSTLGGTALAETVNLMAGDSVLGNAPYRGYASFDLGAVHASAVIESASFSALQLPMEGTPYAQFGALQVYHLSFSSMTDINTVLPLSLPGAFSEDGTEEMKTIDVTNQVIDDLLHRAERGNLTQYRLVFDTLTDGDNTYDRVTFDRDTFVMNLVYVAD